MAPTPVRAGNYERGPYRRAMAMGHRARSVAVRSTRERMPSADAAWLHMDRPSNLMVINAVMWSDEAIDLAALTKVCSERLVGRYRRFSQRVVESRMPLGTPHWEDDPEFELANHLHHLALPAPGDRAALEELVGDLIAVPLDRSKPLWHLYLIDGYEGGAAILTRMHHCIADGIALARVLLSLTDGGEPDGPGIATAEATSRSLGLPGALRTAVRPAAAALATARHTGDAALHEALEIVRHPSELTSFAGDAVAHGEAAERLLVAPPDPHTVLKDPLGVPKRVAWSDPVPLDEIKAIGRAAEATVNDVLVAAVAGALRAYLRRRESPVDEIRAFVPFNLRALDEPLPPGLGNDFGLVFLPLPLGVRGAKARLREVKRHMDEIKSSPEGAVSYAILSAVGTTPPRVEKSIVDLFSAKGSLVLTNVPGPRQPVRLAGAPVRGVLVWAPCSGSVAMSVSIFSYAGEVSVGFLVDAGNVPDPDRLAREFVRELDRLR